MPLVTIFLMSGVTDVTEIRRQFSRFSFESLFLSYVLIAFIEENADSHVYVEGNIVKTYIASFFMAPYSSEHAIQKSLNDPLDLQASLTKEVVWKSMSSISNLASSEEGSTVLASEESSQLGRIARGSRTKASTSLGTEKSSTDNSSLHSI